MRIERPIYSSSVNDFCEIMEDLNHPKLEKLGLDEYQRYNLAIEAMKTDAQKNFTDVMNHRVDDFLHIINATDDHPFAKALNEIADSMGGIGEFPTLSIDSRFAYKLEEIALAIRRSNSGDSP